MAFETFVLEDKHAFLIALHLALLPLDDVSQDSFLWLFWLTAAAGSTDNDAHIEAVKNDLLPDTAPDDGMLDRQGDLKAVVRQGPTPARKDKALRVFGTALQSVDKDLVLTSAAQLTYRIATDAVVGPGGFVDCDVVAIATGSATRLKAGDMLQFVAPPAWLKSTAKLQLDLDEGGTDKEPEGAFRARILSRWKDPPMGGTATDYEQWALEVTGWAAAYCYPIRRGLGTVHLVALHDGSGNVRAPIAPEVADLQAVIDLKRPVSVKGFLILLVTTRAVDVEVTYKPDGVAAHAPDWDDTAAPTCTAWDPANRILTFSAIPELAPGDRVTFKNPTTTTNSGRERTVEALGPGGNQCILEVEDQGDEPEVTGVIYSGGALVQPARDAIIAHFNSIGTANPNGMYGAWEGDIDPDAIGDAVRTVAGVRRATVVTPNALVEASDPAYPNDTSIELLVPGRILVRVAH